MLCSLLFPFAPPAFAQAGPSEYQVKAAYLYNFANFAVWPDASFEGVDSPFRVCLVGGDPFGPVLVNTLRDEKVDGHPLTLVREPSRRTLARCHLLFISDKAVEVEELLLEVAGAPVLTVGERGSFVRQGGILAFVPDAGRIRFDVDLSAAKAAGITLSSRMLQVARQVHQ